MTTLFLLWLTALLSLFSNPAYATTCSTAPNLTDGIVDSSEWSGLGTLWTETASGLFNSGSVYSAAWWESNIEASGSGTVTYSELPSSFSVTATTSSWSDGGIWLGEDEWTGVLVLVRPGSYQQVEIDNYNCTSLDHTDGTCYTAQYAITSLTTGTTNPVIVIDVDTTAQTLGLTVDGVVMLSGESFASAGLSSINQIGVFNGSGQYVTSLVTSFVCEDYDFDDDDTPSQDTDSNDTDSGSTTDSDTESSVSDTNDTATEGEAKCVKVESCSGCSGTYLLGCPEEVIASLFVPLLGWGLRRRRS